MKMATEFTEESVRDFLNSHGGRVKNTDLVTHFKRFLNDPVRKDEMRERFKNYVNTLATIKLDDRKEKILMLKKKYKVDLGGGKWGAHEDSGGGKWDTRAQSEPPAAPTSPDDQPDGGTPSRVRSDGNLSAADLGLSSSTLASTNDTGSIGSGMSSSSSRSLSSVGQEEDNNASVLSVKERAKHLNRIESESEIQKVSTSNLGAVRKKDYKKVRDSDCDESGSNSGTYLPLNQLEKEWLVKCSASDYHLMNELLSKNPHLATVREFTSTALHWAAKKGRPQVIKMLMSKPGVDVNQRTGYTALHLAAIQGHSEIIELLIQTFKADPNIRDYSGKKAKQYLSISASSRIQRLLQIETKSAPSDKSDSLNKTELLVSSRLSSKSGNDKGESGFLRNSGQRKSSRESAIKSLIRVSTGAMKQTVMRSGWGSSEDVINEKTPKSSPRCSPRHSAEPSPVIQRRAGSFKGRDRDLMPPPGAPTRHKSNKHSVSKESLHSEDRKLSVIKQVPRSESEPNLGEMTLPSKSTLI